MNSRFVSLLLAVLLALTAVACSDSASQPSVDTTAAADTTAAETQPEYDYPDVDFEGADYRVLNFDQLWDMYIYIDHEALTGEVLDDAVYERNRRVEEMLGCKVRELPIVNTNNDPGAYATEASKYIAAGDDAYDVMFLPVNRKPTMITDGSLLNLAEMSELLLDETWWDQVVIEAVTFGDKLYFASGSLNLMAFDSAWCLFFNENMLADLSLDTPYQTVRDGKWTIDALYDYCSAAASINGDSGWGWKQDNSCVYGVSTHPNSPEKFLYSAGECYVEQDATGTCVFTAGDTRFTGVIEKLARLLGTKGTALNASANDFVASEGGYYYVFSVRRSVFLTGEIKAAQLLRDMDDTFGIVPLPKYDETQEEYRTNLVSDLFYLTIPATNVNYSRAATISEVLTYESYRTVIPIYYDVTVSQKGLRNDDSIEMLEIMRRTRGIDISVVFGWSDSLRSDINSKLFAADSAIASSVEKYTKPITTAMDKFFAYLDE